ncbi:MAG TPA: peptidoglycan-binding protein [Chthoniobacteraceae bacterium]|nr:peptidoglycan-binding protein [Chthoniobacteraceae bacterium]
MKTSSLRYPLFALTCGLCLAATVQESHAQRRGSVTREGPRGGSVTAEGARYGRFGAGSVEATGPRGNTYEAQGATTGRYSAGSRTVTTAAGTSTATFTGYRSGYVYTGGVYRPATVTVNSVYVAPVGVYAGTRVYAASAYVKYPVYATYPVETSVQVELKRRGYYAGPIDGQIGPGTSRSISTYQSKNGLKVTGKINQALLVSLGIVKA